MQIGRIPAEICELLQASFKKEKNTVTYTESGTPMLNWDSRYLCHFTTEMAEIWSPVTSFQDVWTYKISALNLLYFQSYQTFSGNHLIHH